MEAQYVNSVMALEKVAIMDHLDNFLVIAAKEKAYVVFVVEKDIQDSNHMNEI